MRQEKKELRRTILDIRKLFPEEEKNDLDEDIQNHIKDIPEVQDALHIAIFVSTRFEVDTRPLFEHFLEEGKRVYVPVVNDHEDMDLFEITTLTELEQYFLRRPISLQERFPSHLLTKKVCDIPLDVCILPGLAASHEGDRLGYGGGYYDRFLEDLFSYRPTAFTVFPVYSEFVYDTIPTNPWDQRVDAIVTEKNTYVL